MRSSDAVVDLARLHGAEVEVAGLHVPVAPRHAVGELPHAAPTRSLAVATHGLRMYEARLYNAALHE